MDEPKRAAAEAHEREVPDNEAVFDQPLAEPEDEAVMQDAPAAGDRTAELEAERDDMRDRWMRALADAENARKRADRDRREAEQFGGKRIARDLLPVYDNLQRALDAVPEGESDALRAFVEGVELTQKELMAVFARHGVTVIAPEVGDVFDPEQHEAMFEAPVPGTRKGEIIQVSAMGFSLHGRLLRPAQVGVSSMMAS